MNGTWMPGHEMVGEVDPTAAVARVELYTENRRIVGALDKGRVRVSDAFNNSDISVVRLQNASIYSLYDGNSTVTVAEAQVNPKKVVLVVPLDAGTPTSNDADKNTFHVAKQIHAITIELPPFVVSGNLHLPKVTRLEDALVTIPTKFIPLTAASIAVVGSSSEPAQVSAVIVNRDYVQLMYPGQPAVQMVKASTTLLRRATTFSTTP